MLDDFFMTNVGTQFGTIVIGLAVLTLGRKLFWLATAIAGFILGLLLVVRFAGEQPEWVVLVAAIIVGVIGAVLAVVLQKVAVALAGFFLGGFAAMSLLDFLVADEALWIWVIFIVGAVIGLILALSLLEVALIILSVLAGTILILQATDFGPLVTIVLFFVLIIIGIVIQTKMLPQEA